MTLRTTTEPSLHRRPYRPAPLHSLPRPRPPIGLINQGVQFGHHLSPPLAPPAPALVTDLGDVVATAPSIVATTKSP